MVVFLTFVHIIVCLFLVLVVLLQQGKGGGLGSSFGGSSTQVFGGSGAGNVLTRATGVAATLFMLTSVSLAYLSTSDDRDLRERARLEEERERSEQVSKPRLPTAGENKAENNEKPAENKAEGSAETSETQSDNSAAAGAGQPESSAGEGTAPSEGDAPAQAPTP